MRIPAAPVVLTSFLLLACSEPPLQPDSTDVSLSHAVRGAPQLQQELAAMRRATAKYHDVARAEADGYESVLGCISGPPGAGDMGYHWTSADAIADGTFDPLEPEFLVYAPRAGGGGLHLVALEYYVPDETPTEAEAPELAGEHFHVLPEGHPLYPGYALHAWVWLHNPSGMFADFNPKISCPE